MKIKRKNIIEIIVVFIAAMLIFYAGVWYGANGNEPPKVEASSEKVAISKMETVESAPKYKQITVTATAYCPCSYCCGKCDGITATGTKAKAGRTVAVDPSVIPYGTEIIINGNKYIAEDCGGAIDGNKIDIYFDTHAEALQFGRQTLTALVPIV